jgi:hypothetical protein
MMMHFFLRISSGRLPYTIAQNQSDYPSDVLVCPSLDPPWRDVHLLKFFAVHCVRYIPGLHSTNRLHRETQCVSPVSRYIAFF